MPQLLAPLIIRHIISLHIKEVSVVLTKPVSRGQGRVLSHAYMYTVVSHISSHSSPQLYSSIELHYPDYYCALNSGVQITIHIHTYSPSRVP